MSYATVIYADGKETILNINCKNVNFLHCVRLKCKEVCAITDQIDVADETGECKFLFRNLESYASQYVSERDKLILLKVEEPKPGEKLANNCRFVPLLKTLEDDKDFIVAINPVAGSKANKVNRVNKLNVKKALAASTGTSNATAHSVSPAASNPNLGAGGKRQSIPR